MTPKQRFPSSSAIFSLSRPTLVPAPRVVPATRLFDPALLQLFSAASAAQCSQVIFRLPRLLFLPSTCFLSFPAKRVVPKVISLPLQYPHALSDFPPRPQFLPDVHHLFTPRVVSALGDPIPTSPLSECDLRVPASAAQFSQLIFCLPLPLLPPE